MLIDATLFWFLAAVSIASAVGVVFHRNIIYAALFLVLVFLSIAGFFVLNNADFLAIAQTMIYAVGLTIVLLFGVMLTGHEGFKPGVVSTGRKIAFALVALLFGALLFFATTGGLFMGTRLLPETVTELQVVGSTAMLGKLLFKNYAIPFELASVLLLVAMMGAIILAKKELADDDQQLGKITMDDVTTSVLATDAERDFIQRVRDAGKAQQDDPPKVPDTAPPPKDLSAGVV
jgi:NADH:ubiquinone oxidoreductase subunit 6 (subunit J)